ncbi:MAG: 1-deoxy-D-xylulose-5-phosphate synthase, partial [Clostridiales bacterium]
NPEDIKKLNSEQLAKLAMEIRKFLLDSISRTGGHLASNLGIVELTLAIHHVFDSPKDKIIWDVGHQSYVHKLLTGRREGFENLRQFGGMSGFPKRRESLHDPFETGHSSTSLSAAMGLASARDLNNDNYQVVSIIGDGSLTAGMAYEALNHIGHEQKKMLVILNDNNMAISKNTGALSKHLNKIRTAQRYTKTKAGIKNTTSKMPFIGKCLTQKLDKAKDTVKYMLVPGTIFEEMGLKYIGPVDGHNLEELIDVLNRVRNFEKPVLLHVVTKKGKGYAFSENHPEKFHGIGPFDLNTGKAKAACKGLSYSKVFSSSLAELAEKNESIVAITAAMPDGTGLSLFGLAHPDRYFDVGIAEQHAVTFAAGLASSGKRPFVAMYSSFLQRAYDQLIHDVCLQNLPVVFCIDRAGLVGADGETHHGSFDLSFLLPIPNLTIWSPKDGYELKRMLSRTLELEGPVAIRYPRGACNEINHDGTRIEMPETIRRGNDCLIIAEGTATISAIECAKILDKRNIDCGILNLRQIKPINEKAILTAVGNYKTIITLENGSVNSGMGTQINSILKNFDTFRILNKGYPDAFITHGETSDLLKSIALDPESLANEIEQLLKV